MIIPRRLFSSWALALASALLCAAASAEKNPSQPGGPAVSAVSGPFKNRSVVTVSGTGFGRKDPAPPALWADFEDGVLNPSPLGRISAWNAVDNLSITNENQPPGSRYCAVGNWDIVRGPALRHFSFRVDAPKPLHAVFLSLRAFRTTDMTGNHKVYMRLWPVNNEEVKHDFLVEFRGDGGLCYNEAEPVISGPIGGYAGRAPRKNEWHAPRLTWRRDGGSGLNKDGKTGPGGTGLWDWTESDPAFGGTAVLQHRENVENGPDDITQVRIGDFTDLRHLPAPGAKIYMDDIYLDFDTLAQAALGDAPEKSACTRWIMQIPRTWSNDRITLAANTGDTPRGSPMYLFVSNESGHWSRGFPVTVESDLAAGVPFGEARARREPPASPRPAEKASALPAARLDRSLSVRAEELSTGRRNAADAARRAQALINGLPPETAALFTDLPPRAEELSRALASAKDPGAPLQRMRETFMRLGDFAAARPDRAEEALDLLLDHLVGAILANPGLSPDRRIEIFTALARAACEGLRESQRRGKDGPIPKPRRIPQIQITP